MGTTRGLLCLSCGYKADVSGGPDAGLYSVTHTVVCRQCRELYDVVACDLRKPIAERADFVVRCPRSKKHLVEEWEFPGDCPRCGARMQEDPEGIVCDWD